MKTLKIILLLAVLGLGYYAWRSYTPSGYVFRPYESATLREGSALRDEAQRQKIESELAQFQASLGALTKPEDLTRKLNTLSVIAEYQQMIGKYADAKKTMETALEIQTDAPRLHAYSQLLFTMGAREGALPYIDAATLFAPETPELWRTKIEMLTEIHKDDLSQLDSTYRSALRATDNHIDIITMYATILTRQGRKEDAQAQWELAKQVLPSRADLYQKEIDSLK